MNLTLEARQFLRSTRTGILSTFSARFPEYPFGSVAPFVLDHDGQPIILISTIAEHTKNIQKNPKVSLLVFAGAEDLQANARLTLLGEAGKIEKNDMHLRARYLRYLPQAAGYFDMHDFWFYRIKIHQARYIGGFGKMSWVGGEEFLAESLDMPSNQLAEQEAGIIQHMNADHMDSMMACCRHFHGMTPCKAEMLGLDCDGFDIKATDKNGSSQILRFKFEHPVHDTQSARVALVALTEIART